MEKYCLLQRGCLIMLLALTSINKIYCFDVLTSTFPFSSKLTIDSQNYSKQIDLNAFIQYNSLRVTMIISYETISNGIKPVLVMAENLLPTVYDINKFLESDEVSSQVDTNFIEVYKIDIEGSSMMDSLQFIQIDPPFTNYFYNLAIYDLSLSRQTFEVDILIEFLPLQSNSICPNDCSYNKYQDSSNICMDNVCMCSDKYIGEKCQLKVESLLDDGKKLNVIIDPMKWASYKMELVQIEDSYMLNIINLHYQANISIIKLGQSSINVPNFYHDLYSMPQSVDQNYQISDDILNPYKQYSADNPTSRLAIVISFYNPNFKAIDFTFRISSSGFDDGSNSSVLQNVLVIVICIVGVICLIPFIYICFTSLTKKNEDIQVNALPADHASASNLINGALSIVQRRAVISKEIVDKYMPVTTYSELVSKYPVLKETAECVICLSEFEETNSCRMTVCFHLFHQDCLEGWFKQNDNCPFCRNKLNEKAIIENKENDENNSYVRRITHSVVSDIKNTHGLQDIDSIKVTPTRNRALSTEESTQFGSNDNILKNQVQKRSRFAGFQDNEKVEDFIIGDQNRNNNNNNNGISNIDEDELGCIQGLINGQRRFRSESAQISRASGDQAIVSATINLPPNNFSNCNPYKNNNSDLSQENQQNSNNEFEEEHKEQDYSQINQRQKQKFKPKQTKLSSQEQLKQQPQQTSNQAINFQNEQSNQIINLDSMDYSPSLYSTNTVDINERTPHNIQMDYHSHDFQPSNNSQMKSKNVTPKTRKFSKQSPLQMKKHKMELQVQSLKNQTSIFGQEIRESNNDQTNSQDDYKFNQGIVNQEEKDVEEVKNDNLMY